MIISLGGKVMKTLFLNGKWTILSTIFVVLVLSYITVVMIKNKKITNWGIHIMVITFGALYLCYLAATRDGYVESVQNIIDGTTQIGVFAVNSIQSYLAAIGGIAIILIAIVSIFIKKQKYGKRIFSILSLIIIFKIFLIEISRIILL